MNTQNFIEFIKKNNISVARKGNTIVFVNKSGREVSGNALSSLARKFLQENSGDTRQRTINILIKDVTTKLKKQFEEKEIPIYGM